MKTTYSYLSCLENPPHLSHTLPYFKDPHPPKERERGIRILAKIGRGSRCKINSFQMFHLSCNVCFEQIARCAPRQIAIFDGMYAKKKSELHFHIAYVPTYSMWLHNRHVYLQLCFLMVSENLRGFLIFKKIVLENLIQFNSRLVSAWACGKVFHTALGTYATDYLSRDSKYLQSQKAQPIWNRKKFYILHLNPAELLPREYEFSLQMAFFFSTGISIFIKIMLIVPSSSCELVNCVEQ